VFAYDRAVRYREEGVRRGLMRGLGVTLMRDIPGSALYYGVYEVGPDTSSQA
jgi:transmembrane carrier protein